MFIENQSKGVKKNRKSLRLRDYDYSQNGFYFITICCHDRESYFGNIVNGFVELNEGGFVAHQCWVDIPNHYPNVKIHDFVIMPDHIHGMIEICKPAGDEYFQPEYFEPKQFQPGQIPKRNEYQKIIPGSIGAIIRGYKIGVTKWFRQNTEIDIVWQKNFYEKIIDNQNSYRNISKYIRNNPQNWKSKK